MNIIEVEIEAHIVGEEKPQDLIEEEVAEVGDINVRFVHLFSAVEYSPYNIVFVCL